MSKGTQGAPILVLEENHASRAGQIQHAITLVRLYDRHGLRHLVLEGYLKERPEITTDWFTQAVQGLSPAAGAGVAVRLLQEGEISSAEFMKLVYPALVLHHAETRSEYEVELDTEAWTAPRLYLFKLGQQALRPEHAAKVRELQEASQKLTGEAQQKKRAELVDYVFSVDPWVQGKAKVLQDTKALSAMSAEQHLALIEEIAKRAQERSVQLEPRERAAMERNLAFWRERSKGSDTMVGVASAIADRQGVSVVAMIVGAAHTARVTDRLAAAKRPFAVLTPLTLKNRETKGDLTGDQFQRKGKRLSVYSKGSTELLLKAFPSPQKKPEPVLSEAWFQGKAELYGLTARIVRRVLGLPPGGGRRPPPPPGSPPPPSDFPDDNEFRGRWVFIDPRRITVQEDDAQQHQGRVVVFPVQLNPNDSARRTTIWVKAGLGVATAQARESVEAMLQQALTEVQAEQTPRETAEDAAGRVQMDLDTLGAIGGSEAAAMAVKLGV